MVTNKSKDGVCEPCKVLLNNLIVSQFKEESVRSPEVKQVIEEEEEDTEKKFPDHYDEDNDVDFYQDIPHSGSDRGSEDEEDVDDEDHQSDPEYNAADKFLLKPTVIKIMKRDVTRVGNDKKEGDYQQCEYCDHQSPNREALRKHRVNWHEPPKFQCPQCSFKARTKPNLKTHVDTVHNDNRVQYSCDQCSKIFYSRKGLLSHKQSFHKGIRHTCEQCGKCFVQKNRLKMHMKTAHEGLRFSCDQCDFSSENRCYLRKHKKIVHQKIKSFLCDQCDYKAAQKCTLIQHIETVHDGIRHQCDQCQYQATTKGALKKHMVIVHSGVKLQCDQCNYQTAQQRVLDTHIRFVHQGIGYTCDICGHKTSTDSNLKQHITRKHQNL